MLQRHVFFKSITKGQFHKNRDQKIVKMRIDFFFVEM